MSELRDNPFYFYEAPKKPAIRKLGTILCDMVETAPFVFRDRLYRFESVRPHGMNPANPLERSFFRVVDAESGESGAPFGYDHHLGSAFARGDEVVALGVKDRWAGDTVTLFRSRDLVRWEETDVRFPGLRCFNTNLAEKDGATYMLIESEEGVPFTFRFAKSKDLRSWELLPEEFIFQKDRYAGGPALYTLPDDPHFYVLYLEAYPGPCYANCIARSLDLKEWEYSPLNPVLMYGEEDRRIADPRLSGEDRARIERALDINNSDAELCEYRGRTVIYYSWGCQRGIEFLAEARCDMRMKAFLQGFFGEKPPV
ncbi:MAG: hypothetical protein IKX85_05170 [Clostridia bacterium]|nr:hypothetical protein [Clostridia bacterium]